MEKMEMGEMEWRRDEGVGVMDGRNRGVECRRQD